MPVCVANVLPFRIRLDKGRMLCNSAGKSNPGREEMKWTK
jgi:hypothetical protein